MSDTDVVRHFTVIVLRSWSPASTVHVSTQPGGSAVLRIMSSSSSSVLFVIVGRNEPLYEAEFNKRPGSGDAVTRQNYFVLHSALDLVEKAAWTTSNMYLKVVDKVSAMCR
jgi:Sedlin, N-terminal conserved region